MIVLKAKKMLRKISSLRLLKSYRVWTKTPLHGVLILGVKQNLLKKSFL